MARGRGGIERREFVHALERFYESAIRPKLLGSVVAKTGVSNQAQLAVMMSRRTGAGAAE